MNNPFFISALAAANVSVEAFEAEFKKEEANVYARQYKGDFYFPMEYGDYLIYKLINTLPDEKLPPLLAVLLKNKLDLEIEITEHTPLALAALYCKRQTFDFLIANNPIINKPRNNPVLCAAVSSQDHPIESKLAIVKILVEQYQANINIRDEYSRTALMRAASTTSLEIIEYLLSKGADLFLGTKGGNTITALGIAYIKYISARKSFPKENDSYTARHKACVTALIKAAYQKLYYDAVRFIGTEDTLLVELHQRLDTLVGNFQEAYQEANSQYLKELLTQQVLAPLLARIKREKQQRIVFCSGSKESLQENKSIGYPINTAYFRNSLFDRNTAAMIFSYMHEATPMKIKEMDEEKENNSLSTCLQKK